MSDPKSVLVVNDDPTEIDFTVRSLESQKLPIKILVAHDGIEALDCLHCRGRFTSRSRENPVFVLLDLKMPLLDAFGVLLEIKSDPRLRTIPVIMFSSSGFPPDIVRCYDLGANAYVVKPVEYADFAEKIKQISLFWTVTNEAPPPFPAVA